MMSFRYRKISQVVGLPLNILRGTTVVTVYYFVDFFQRVLKLYNVFPTHILSFLITQDYEDSKSYSSTGKVSSSL